jgi:dipeptidyl aminopeptidase/acylaminoacyl peptidase
MNTTRSALFTILTALLTALCFAPNNLHAQPDTTRWTPELTMQYDQITDTEISPDGQHVAYVVQEAVMDETTSEFRQQIHVVATDGSSDVQYTRGDRSSFSPKWSPSGDRIAFLSARGGPPQVYLMRLRGGEPYRVTDAETGVSSFQWGPGGERIAYTMTDPKSDAERQRETEKRDVNVVGEEHRYAHLYTTEVKPADDTTRTVQRLTRGDFHVTGFDWAPDGSTIAFEHRPTPWVNSNVERDLSTVPADSGVVERLVEQPGADTSPRYSPDGQTVAFVSKGGERAWEGLGDVYTVPTEGGEPAALGHTPNREATLLGWTAGGDALLVSDQVKASSHVYVLPLGRGAAQQVTNGKGLYRTPFFGAPPSYSHSSDRLAFVYQNSTTPSEVYVGSRQDFARRQLTTVNANVPKPKLGRTELVTWTGSGGQKIEGLLTYPVGYESGRVPLVLHVHGGPSEAHARAFTGGQSYLTAIYKTQVFAEHGYAVLRPNPRGSTGYGHGFREAVIANWAKGPYEDLVAGVDKMIEMGVAHPDSLVLTGWSYGGYMTAWLVTQTDRFQAASMGAGVSNLISMTGTTDIPRWQAGQMGGGFWDRQETYEANSPIYHVKSASTPTQILHSAEDDRVPPSQGREFYRALDRRGVPIEMVLYPRSGHVPHEPKLQMDVTPRIIDWFDEHLGRSSEASNTTSSGE